jgi:hypothetical protein
VAFVWVLEREMALVPEHEMHLTAHAQDRNQRVGLGEGWRAMPVRALGKFVGPPTLRLHCPPQREGCWGGPHPKSEPVSERWIDPGDDQTRHGRPSIGDSDRDQLGQRLTPSRTAR